MPRTPTVTTSATPTITSVPTRSATQTPTVRATVTSTSTPPEYAESGADDDVVGDRAAAVHSDRDGLAKRRGASGYGYTEPQPHCFTEPVCQADGHPDRDSHGDCNRAARRRQL